MKDKHKFYLDLCERIAEQSYAERSKVGALLEKDGNIIAFGYNGMPSDFPNTCETTSFETKPEVLHAESNAIAKCAKTGIAAEEATLYCLYSPCLECAKLIIQAGIAAVIYREEYRIEDGLRLLKGAGIVIVKYPEESYLL